MLHHNVDMRPDLLYALVNERLENPEPALRYLHEIGLLAELDIMAATSDGNTPPVYVLRNENDEPGYVYNPIGCATDLQCADSWASSVEDAAKAGEWDEDSPNIATAQQRAGTHYATGMHYSASSDDEARAENDLATCNLWREIIGLEPVTWEQIRGKGE